MLFYMILYWLCFHSGYKKPFLTRAITASIKERITEILNLDACLSAAKSQVLIQVTPTWINSGSYT